MEALALHDFKATAKNDLSFKKGNTLKVLNFEDNEQWYTAELEGKEGLIPQNYVDFKIPEWFFSKLPREKVEEDMNTPLCQDDTFLVRESVSEPGDFSFSVKHCNSVQHFKILRDGAGKYFLWLQKFSSIQELIDHHKTSSVSRTETILLKHIFKGKQTVVAVYDFQSQDSGELDFSKGDVITLLDSSNEHWWTGRLEGKSGVFPSSYVKLQKVEA